MWVDILQFRRSRMQQVLQWLSLAIVALLLVLSGLSWPFKLVALIGLGVFYVFHRHAQQRQVRLSSLQQHDRVRWQWQQSAPPSTHQPRSFKQKRRNTRDITQIQAHLLRVEAWLGIVVILRFEVVALGQRQTWLVWRDQTDLDNWRRLQVLQRYWSAKLE